MRYQQPDWNNRTYRHAGVNYAEDHNGVPNLLLGLACMPHNQRHILDLAEGRHGRIAGQAKQQIRARVVLRDLPHHAPVRAVAAH